MLKNIKHNLSKNIKYYLFKIKNSRVAIVGVFFGVFIIIAVARLFYLQIVKSDYYLDNYIQTLDRTVYTTGTRGTIYDRNGEILAYNELTYSVVMEDTSLSDEDLNEIANEMIEIIEENGDELSITFPIALNSDGTLTFAATSDSALVTFLVNIYGETTSELKEYFGVDELTEDTIDVDDVFEYLLSDDKFDIDTDEYTLEEQLEIAAVRYELSLNSYSKYVESTIADDVSEETVAAILENQSDLEGVDISEDSVRVYNNSVYFASILGYTGDIDDDDISTLEKLDTERDIDYEDEVEVVGKTGLEQYLDSWLQGTEGEETLYVDSTGTVLEETVESEAEAGYDVYTTLDSEMQIAVYNILEQEIAGILVDKIVDYDYEADADDDEILIGIKDVYFQMINNNVVDLSEFNDDDATDNEKTVYNAYISRLDTVMNEISDQLSTDDPTAMSDLSDEYNDYMWYIYDALEDGIDVLDSDDIDTDDDTYNELVDEDISMQEFIQYAIEQGWISASSMTDVLDYAIEEGWMDESDIGEDGQYATSDELYEALVDYIIYYISENTGFAKEIYNQLIQDETITGSQVCCLLYDQGVLDYDEDEYDSLSSSTSYAYTWMIEKLTDLEITPAQVALDPCSGSVVVTDVDTGDVLALVTYPSYDNNELSGSIDSDYWTMLNNDLSLPLYNRATQTRTAPGSTFKMLTAITALEEGVIDEDDVLECTGEWEYTDTDTPSCWLSTGHGELNVVGAIENSCNVFFYQVGYMLGEWVDGELTDDYSKSRGIAYIEKWAEYVGLTTKSGVEIYENDPELADSDPVYAAIGQDDNSFTNTQLARYVTTIANGGTCYELTLLDKVTDSDGETVYEFENEVTSSGVIDDDILDIVQEGMYDVVTSGTASSIFSSCDFTLAGKTGTAQESELRSNHALFVGYTPYDDPEIAVSVVIPYGVTSSNAAEVGEEVMEYYYGELTLDDILEGSADSTDTTIAD